MSKKPSSFKRYIYISQGKIGMYANQLPRRWWQRIGDWLLHISRAKVGPVELDLPTQNEQSQHQKMLQIIDQIKKQHTVGTIDQPAAYIHDTLPMFSVLIPSKPEYRRLDDDPGLVYFGGGTKQTSLGLVGSPQHLINFPVDEKSRIRSSDIPRLIEYINKRINEIVPGRSPRYKGLGAVWYADHYNTEDRTPMEFFAYRIHDSEQTLYGLSTEQKRVLLYTPIYVVYKD